jgi:transcriptional regulator with XRE-family HTH domain
MAVTSRERTSARARIRARSMIQELGLELREARLAQGRRLVDVAGPAGMSRSHLSRVELGVAPAISIASFVTLCAELGLEFSARIYPGQRPLRDGPQLELLRHFRTLLGPSWAWRYEVPVGARDQRAWDARAVHRTSGSVVVVEAETRIRDAQAILRRIGLKREASGAPRTVLLVAGSRHNRDVLREAGDYLRTAFPIGTRAAIGSLARGVDPGADCLVVVVGSAAGRARPPTTLPPGGST